MDEVANGDPAEQEGWTALPRRGGRGLKLGAVRKARAAGVDMGAYPKNRGRSLYRGRVILGAAAGGEWQASPRRMRRKNDGCHADVMSCALAG